MAHCPECGAAGGLRALHGEPAWRKILRVMSCVSLMLAVIAPFSQATAQTNTFSLQADPPSIDLAPGQSGVVTISSAVVSGTAETITFDASGAPADVTLTFEPSSVDAGMSTVLTITAASNATLGETATITISGTSPSDSETTTVSLRVGRFLSLDEWSALASLYEATGGLTWTKNTGWDFSGSGPNGAECEWYGIECDSTPHVIALSLQNNNLNGSLTDVSALSNLVSLDFFGDHLTGPLPASIQNMTSLTEILLTGNQLSGSLDVLDGLSNLQLFDADDNEFTGELPQLASMPNLINFSVQGNQLTGPMPSLAHSSKLIYLDVSGNYLVGTVPSLSALVNLRYLYISGNRLTGVMPNPPASSQLIVAFLCPNFFAPINNLQWNALLRTAPWYSSCDTNTIFGFGFGVPPSLQ